MRPFRDLSFRTKLIVLMAGLVSLIVAFVCAAFVINSVRTVRATLTDRHVALADILAADSPLALAFPDETLATEILASLEIDPAVKYACLVDAEHRLLASYPPDAKAKTAPPAKADGFYFNQQGDLEVYRTVVHEGHNVGNVYLLASMQQVQEVLRRDLWTAGIVLGVSLISVILLTTLLQRIISTPILRLADAARRVSGEHDYSIRVAKLNNDELGTLSDGFNAMLTEIQARDQDLRVLNENLEERVRERTAELQREQYLLNTLVDNIPDAVFFKDCEGRFLRVNQAMLDNAGLSSSADLIGKTDADIWTGPVATGAAADERMILETGEPLINKEEHLTNADGAERWVLVTKMPLRDENGDVTGIFGVARDITARKREELQREEYSQTLARAKEALERSNADLQQFAYVASHDLQEPLRAVAGYCQLLEGKLSEEADEEVRLYLRHATEGAKRMQALINSLLDYARVGTRGKEFLPVDANAILADALANLRVAIQESQAVVTANSLPTILADREQLAQLFQNLIGNAIKFQGKTPPEIHIDARKANGDWVFSVRDNGIGLEQQYADKIFIIFQRLHTRSKFPGTGLGLAITKRIVERHNGRVWVESTLGEGSTFFFTIPGAG